MTLPVKMTENEDYKSDSPPSKRFKKDLGPKASSSTESCNSGILNFCDDLLLEIFSYVEISDLLPLSQCCQRFKRVVGDRTLWINVDFRPTPLVDSDLKKFIKFFLPSTKLLATRGPWAPPQDPTTELVATVSGELLRSIRTVAPNINTFILENHIIDCKDLPWEKLSHLLEYLSFRTCQFINVDQGKSVFFGIDKCLPQLKVLEISACPWFQSHSLLALSKCKQLEELRVPDCMINDFVPYISLSTRFGFKALTIVDFRRTWVSDREVSCLNKTATLRELYLEAPAHPTGQQLITDMAVTAFGGTLEEWNRLGFIVVLMPQFEGFKPSPLEVIELCNYVNVTGTSLRHCASCLKGLKRINVKGTSCKLHEVLKFKIVRPDVIVESDFEREIKTLEPPSDEDNT